MANTPLPTNLDVDIWASNATEPDLKLDPGSTKYAEGWDVELARVDYENFIQNRQDQAIANMVENGVPHWESTITYQRQSTVRSPVDGYVYCAINNGVVGGSDPSSDVSGNWVKQDEFTTDSISQNIQTFADSSLNNINFNTNTKVINKDGSNLDTAANASLIANRDLSNVTAENLATKLSSSNAVTLSVVNQKVNINAPIVKSVAHDYLSTGSDENNLQLTAVSNQQAPTVYFDEMTISFRYPVIFTENTGAVFINLNNIGVAELVDLQGNSLTQGALLADDHLEAIYSTTFNSFFVRQNSSPQSGIYGTFIAHSIIATNTVSSTTTVTPVTLTGTPLAHCKTLLIEVTLQNLGSDSIDFLEAGARIVSTPAVQTFVYAVDTQGSSVTSNQIMVSADDLELFASVPAFTSGAISVTAEIIGGYR